VSDDPAGGLLLEFDGQRRMTDQAEVNETLRPVGAGVWPIDLGAAPDDVRDLLRRPVLDDAATGRIMQQFLLSRSDVLEVIARAGRTPEFPDGGRLETLDVTDGVNYPQLYLVDGDTDYTRFDHPHRNTTAAGPGVDEVLQLVSGGGFRLMQELPAAGWYTLTLDCPDDSAGWVLTYDGSRPHMGSLTRAQVGTKLVVQAIGPAEWEVEQVGR
jgi:hypothetical protein